MVKKKEKRKILYHPLSKPESRKKWHKAIVTVLERKKKRADKKNQGSKKT